MPGDLIYFCPRLSSVQIQLSKVALSLWQLVEYNSVEDSSKSLPLIAEDNLEQNTTLTEDKDKIKQYTDNKHFICISPKLKIVKTPT